MRAITTNTVACMTPFVNHKRESTERSMYTEPASANIKPPFCLSSCESSELTSRESTSKKSIYDRLFQIINSDSIRYVKRRKLK